ncbi:MAG: DUF1194 domain-containing protein [Rhizobiales bacterium]|nr:DUF1194 domain-containing protein [Hyphomicrobiales bacterium]
MKLELVLAIDTSTSVDTSEFELQKHGLALAFRHPSIVRAIETIGELGMVATVVQWSSNGKHLTAVDWAAIRDADSAKQFADAIDAMPRLLTGFTGIASAIRFSLEKIEENNYMGERKVIDISGDGASSSGEPGLERDRAIARGVTVNGLAILTSDPDFMELGLTEYYADNVVGGRGAFLMTADGFEDFVTVIRKKLIREITSPGVAMMNGQTIKNHSNGG